MKFLYYSLFLFISLQVSAAAPTKPAKDLSFPAIDGGFLNVRWSAGDGLKRVIICKAGSPVTFVPQNGQDYTENTEFGSGQMVAPGEYVVYDNAFTSFFLTKLSAATQYFFAIYEYNGSGANTEYLTSQFLTGSGTTSATPTSQTKNAQFPTITTNSVTITWEVGDGARRLILMREGSPVNADPVNNTPYNGVTAFGNGAVVGSGNFSVHNASGTFTTVTNLKAGTTYHLAFYEFNGSGQPQYLKPAYTNTVTTRSVPTTASTNLVVTKTDGKELGFSWTSGNGQRRIIVAKQGSDITSLPANGTDYAANATFGSGDHLGTGEFVVYDDNFNEATVSGLNPATTYYFRIFEYDGTGTNTSYLTSSFAAINTPTAATPGSQSANVTASNITKNSLNLQFNPGTGRGRLVIGRKDAAVNFVPQDFTVYPADADFGTSAPLGNGNFALSYSLDNGVIIHNLQPNSTYHFAVFEFNGYNQPLYRTPAATFSATTSNTLPVKLSKWEAIPMNNKVQLKWTTDVEVNASHFVIERSANGTNFSPVATEAATGNSAIPVNYSKEDNSPLTGKSYYRLHMIDLDGQSEYSSTLSVLLTEKTEAKILRNPVQQVLEVNIPSGKSEWQIVNVSGQLLQKGISAAGKQQIPVGQLPKGSYWLRVQTANQFQVLPFIKQ